MRMVQALGGSPTPISWGELYTSLQQGVVDGAENNPPSFFLSRHYEVSRYYTINEHTAVPDVLVISTHIWSTLTLEQREILQQAASESARYQKLLWKEASDDALAAVKAAGVEIIYPDKKPFQERVKTMIDSYRQNERIDEILTQIENQ
jgi:TRAP-type C4-dicarboxylate transport system substrate-binding protein